MLKELYRADGKVDFTFRGVVLEKNATVKLVADLDKDVSVRTISSLLLLSDNHLLLMQI